MATVQEPTRAAGRHESFVAAQIDRATRRIRGHDVGIATLGLVAGLLAYTLGMKMTQEEWDAFQKAYAERLKQKTAPGAGENQRGGTAGRSAANTGPRRVQGGTDKQNPLERGSIIQPPAEYRDGYRGFTEDLSKSPPPKKDQK